MCMCMYSIHIANISRQSQRKSLQPSNITRSFHMQVTHQPYTYPWTVMIHTQCTLLAYTAMVGSGGFHDVAFLALSVLTGGRVGWGSVIVQAIE